MKKIAVFFAEGFEEIEALTVVDICRRCGLEVCMVSVTEDRMVKGSHGIVIKTDDVFSHADFREYDMLVLPGGMPGTKNLEAHEGLMAQVDAFYTEGKYIAAICAAPSVLGKYHCLEGKRATCYPGWEDKLLGAEYTGEGVVRDGNVVTGRGLGFAIDEGLELLKVLVSEAVSADVREAIQHP